MKTVVLIILVIGIIAVAVAMYKSGHFIKSLFKSIVQGVFSLVAVNVIGLASGITLSLNWYTLLFSAVFGLPATITLTVFKFIFR